MSKNTYRINESQLRGLIAESIKRALNEGYVSWYNMRKKEVFSTCEPISADEFFQMISGITSERDLMSEIGNFCFGVMEDSVEDEKEDGIHCNWEVATETKQGIVWGACGVSEVTYYKNDQGDYWTPPYFDVEFGDIDIEEGWVSYNGKVADIKDLILGYIR